MSLAPDRTPRRRILESFLGVPFTDGNQVDVLRNGEEMFPALLEGIAASTRSIDLLWFAWRSGAVDGRLTDALASRAAAGVQVRVLLDAYGGRRISSDRLSSLRRAGCHVLSYRPLPSARPTVWNLRTHRRVLVCDEALAFTGGTGIADEWDGDGHHPGSWRDTGVRVAGPAVAGLRAAFAGPWFQTQARWAGGTPLTPADRCPPLCGEGTSAVQVLRSSSAPGWNDAALAVAALLQTASTRVRACTPYARLPHWLLTLVADTARRGVTVQLLVSGPHVDRPSVHLQAERQFQQLLDAGVEIWRYQPSLMHGKVLTVDRQLSMVGTTNLDVRSLTLNEQVCLLVDDPSVTAVLDSDFDEDLRASERVTDAGWKIRPVRRRVLEMAADALGRPLRGWGGAGLAGPRPHLVRSEDKHPSPQRGSRHGPSEEGHGRAGPRITVAGEHPPSAP
ncbi:phospholipase D-like domain-containing protein [Blastococcus aggregatus]|nr:phospholipase D-like domain-containing protein [Blastococcus aggregatus]